MSVWSGQIFLDDNDPTKILKDVRLHVPERAVAAFVCDNVIFWYLSFVDCAAVPLHLVSGPAFEVVTEDQATEDWFGDVLLHNPVGDEGNDSGALGNEWWTRNCWQSDVGILLKVDGTLKATQNGVRTTELLLYAATVKQSRAEEAGILTPPRSSSPNHGLEGDNQATVSRSRAPIIKLYAVPLSSELWSRSRQMQSLTAEDLVGGFAQFLPSPPPTAVEEEGPRKRQRLDSLFEDATKQVKRAKRRGGESVAKNMSQYIEGSSQKALEPRTQADRNESQNFASPLTAASKLPRELGISRSQSLGSLRDLDNMRTSSRAGTTAPAVRSSLHRVTSASARESSSPVPDAVNGVEQQNKAALARVVMAGMRMYGLQQKKKIAHSRAVSEIPVTADFTSMSVPSHGEEDEYKMVYHQTYKAAACAFRTHMAVVGIGQDVMRETVDQLLGIFCTDPMDKSKFGDALQHAFGS